MSSLIFLLAVVLLVDASPSVSPAPEADPAPEVDPASSDCPSCSVSPLKTNASSPSSDGQSDMVEAVKRHILNTLHLSARPNLTHPVPRAALLNAIQKLHVGHVAEDGSIQIQEENWASSAPAPPEPTSEMIVFAEAGVSPNMMTFDLSNDSLKVVEQANVWIFLKMSKGSRKKGKVSLRLLRHRDDKEEGECVSEKMADTRRSGWHTLSITDGVRDLFSGSGGSSLVLSVSCPLCAEAGARPVLTDAQREPSRDPSHRPFVMVLLRDREEEAAQRRVRRALECDGKIHICCKRQFYVNFKDIGWNDWIIAPPGYHANYCEGECPNHVWSPGGSPPSFHATVINHYRMRGFGPFQRIKSCCVPTRLRAMSMLYYNEEQKIIKKDIHDMIVDECGCS